MSDQPDRENLDGEFGTHSLDDEDQLQPEDTLIGSEDPLDRGYETADRLQGTTAWGTTPLEERTEETINQRIGQEVPDPQSAYGAPDNEGGLDPEPRLGGDDPDSIPAEQDWVGDSAEPVDRLVAPDEGLAEDSEKDLVAEEVDDPSRPSPEGSAMHYTDEDREQQPPG